MKAVVDDAQRLFRQSRERVTTGRLNTLLQNAVETNPPPTDARHRRVRIYYATQAETAPPTIVLSTSAPKSVSEPYRRYLLNVLRQHTPSERCRSGSWSAAAPLPESRTGFSLSNPKVGQASACQIRK